MSAGRVGADIGAAATVRNGIPIPESVRRGAVPALVVTGAVLGIELAYGTPLGDAIVYLAYELGFVILPGLLAYLALAGRPAGPLRQLAMGWALGYVLEILAFMLTAWLGVRGLFVAYPFVVGAAAIAILRARRRPGTATTSPALPPRAFAWVLAAVCLGAIGYMALAYFPSAQLPGKGAVTLYPDYSRWISVAAEAKHHFPIGEPSAAGEPLPYHYFIYVHMAAASQVTGIEVYLVLLRLFILPLTVLLVLQLAVAGRSLARSTYAGLIAACLVFFVGELRLDTRPALLTQTPLIDLNFIFLYRSPSYLFGLVIFVPLATLLSERLSSRVSTGRVGDWLLVTLFMVGAVGSKVTTLPVVLGAIGLYAACKLLFERRIPRAAWIGALLAVAVWGVFYVLEYRGQSSGLRLDPFATFDRMPAVTAVENAIRDLLPSLPGEGALATVGGILFGLIGLLLAPLVGLLWVFGRRGMRLDEHQIWLLCLLLVGVLGFLALDQPGVNSQLYFLFTGLVAGCILSADGIREAWRRRPAHAGVLLRTGGLGVAFLVVLAALMAAPGQLDLFAGPAGDPHRYLFLYGGLVAALALLCAAAVTAAGPTRWPAFALPTAAVLVIGALAAPISTLWQNVQHPKPRAVLFGQALTPQMFDALRWIRRETPTDSVVAVNNQWFAPNRTVPLAFDYSAFSERRVFLEGWGYSQAAFAAGYDKVSRGTINPFADRLALNERAFTRGDRVALNTMRRRFGVRYLVIDPSHGYRADLPALERTGRVVYRAMGVTVLELPDVRRTS